MKPFLVAVPVWNTGGLSPTGKIPYLIYLFYHSKITVIDVIKNSTYAVKIRNVSFSYSNLYDRISANRA